VLWHSYFCVFVGFDTCEVGVDALWDMATRFGYRWSRVKRLLIVLLCLAVDCAGGGCFDGA
jgi:hypothetical protein